MIRKEIEIKNSKAYVFDVDDTLVTTDAKIIIRDSKDRIVKKITPAVYNTYEIGNGERFDFMEFDCPKIFRETAKPTFFLSLMQKISKAVQNKKSNSSVYILTARTEKVKKEIHEFLKSKGIEISECHIHTIGDNQTHSVAEVKKQVLETIKKNHKKNVFFFDDDEKNLALAKGLDGVKARHVRI